MSDAVTIKGLDEIIKRLDAVPREMKEEKKQLLEELGQIMAKEVGNQVSARGVNDSSGRIADFQRFSIGTYGGYVAVRPVAGYTDDTKNKVAIGALTQYLEGGHAFPGQGVKRGGAKGAVQSSAGQGYVQGFHFYRWAKMRLGFDLKRKAKQSAQALLERTARKIAGEGS